MNTKLPVVMAGNSFGWRSPGQDDPLSLLGGGAPSVRRKEAVLEVAAAAGALGNKLDPLAPTDHFVLPSGVTVEIVEQPHAPLVAITTRIAGRVDAKLLPGQPDLSTVSGVAPAEERSTLTVPGRSLEAGVDVAVRRLRIALGEGDGGVALRRAASAPYRHDLALLPEGPAWLALGDALFPKGHPLEGAIVTGRADPALFTDLFLAEEMRKEHAPRRATISIAGDVSRSRVEKAFATAIFAAQSGDQEIDPPAHEQRVSVESPGRRVLYGWLGPAEGQPGHAAMRVAIEILTLSKGGRLRKALMEDAKLATEVTGVVESNPRSAVAAIEVVPTEGSAPSVEDKLDGLIAELAEKGPSANEVAVARAFISARIEKARKAAQVAAPPKGAPQPPPVSGAALPSASRALLDPAAFDRLLTQLGEVAPGSVKLAATRLLAKDHRVVVTAGPKKSEP